MPGSKIELKPEQANHLASLVIKLGKGPMIEGAAIKAGAGARLALACAGAIRELDRISANDTISELTLVEKDVVAPEQAISEEQKIIKEINSIIFDLNSSDLNALMGLDKRPE